MVTKAFIGDTTAERYADFVPDANTPGNKAGTFIITIPWYMCTDTIPEISGPTAQSGSFDLSFPVGSQPSSVYQICYNNIVQLAQSFGFDIPQKSDVYACIPTTFDNLL